MKLVIVTAVVLGALFLAHPVSADPPPTPVAPTPTPVVVLRPVVSANANAASSSSATSQSSSSANSTSISSASQQQGQSQGQTSNVNVSPRISSAPSAVVNNSITVIQPAPERMVFNSTLGLVSQSTYDAWVLQQQAQKRSAPQAPSSRSAASKITPPNAGDGGLLD